MQKRRNRICMLLICVLLISLSAVPVFAAALEDSGKLTVQSHYSDTPIAGMTYSLYRVADVDQGPKYIPTTAYPVDLDVETADAWDGVAQTLLGYIQMDRVEASYTATTGDDGNFTVDVERGLYLVVGKTMKQGEYIYKVKPAMVSVPTITDGAWDFDVTVSPKPERTQDYTPAEKPERETVDRKALKIWEDEGYEELRPDEITVHLLRSGEVFKTETLNAENNWSCEWRGLDAKAADGAEYEWNVVEEPLDDYTVTVEQDGITYVLTNTYLEEVPEDPVPLSPGEPGEPEEPLEELPEDPVPLAGLPQTGLLWWPVPICLCLGIACLILGISAHKRTDA